MALRSFDPITLYLPQVIRRCFHYRKQNVCSCEITPFDEKKKYTPAFLFAVMETPCLRKNIFIFFAKPGDSTRTNILFVVMETAPYGLSNFSRSRIYWLFSPLRQTVLPPPKFGHPLKIDSIDVSKDFERKKILLQKNI